MARVLLVDDEHDYRSLARMSLEDAGYDVLEARDGQEALRALDEAVPDIVLLDISMPQRDGWEVLGDLKADRRLRGVPVVMVSWRDEPDAQLRGIASGAVAYVPKPSASDALLRVVERTLLRRS